MADKNTEYWIRTLKLEPHPEGGYFRQTYRSSVTIAREALPQGFTGRRAASTAIYFMLEGKNFSAFHRLRSDEVWHFYAGSPLVVHVIDPSGKLNTIVLGREPEMDQSLQAVVPAGSWFASHVLDWQSFALVGCTVAPGFDFDDFELGRRGELTAAFPQHRELIARLTRG